MAKYVCPTGATDTENSVIETLNVLQRSKSEQENIASVAKKEGYEQIASLFEATANNEKEHAKMWFKELGELGNTAYNLLHAAESV